MNKYEFQVFGVCCGAVLTVKLLNFGTQKNFAVIYLQFKHGGQTLKVFRPKDADGIANSEDPGQTAPLGAV